MEGQATSEPRTSVTYRLQTTPHMKKVVTFGPWADAPEKIDSYDSRESRESRDKQEPKRRSTATGRVSEQGESSGGRRSTGAFTDPKVHGRSSVGARQSGGEIPFEHHDPLMRRMSAATRPAPSADESAYDKLPPNVTIYMPEATTELPDWYIELTPNQEQLFQKMLRLLDSPAFSDVHRDELFGLVKEVINDITHAELGDLVKNIQDQSPDGKVDFDEFLFALSERETKEKVVDLRKGEEKQEKEEHAKKKEKRRYSAAQKLFYSTIAKFSVLGVIDSTLEVQRRHLIREAKSPHVLSHFLQSEASKYGKSQRHLRRLMVKMLKDARGQFSPFAHPLPFVRLDGRPRPSRLHQCPRRKPDKANEAIGLTGLELQSLSPIAMLAMKKLSLEAEERQETPNVVVTDGEIYLDDADINTVLEVYRDNGSVAARLPDVHLVPGMHDMLASISIYDSLSSSQRKRRETMMLLRQHLQTLQMESPMVRHERQRKNRIKFFMPHVRRFLVRLPSFNPTRCERLNVTPVNIANMRIRMDKQLADYRLRLKLSHVYHAWTLLGRLNLDNLPPAGKERFLQIYRAYEPMKLRDIFVINPYRPHLTYID